MAPTDTHSLMSGQHTCFAGHALVSEGSQRCPGFVGVRQCFASGQQYDLGSAHGDLHAAPTLTQIFVSGQQVSPVAHGVVVLHVFFGTGVKQCLASGQQNSVVAQAPPLTLGVFLTARIDRMSKLKFPAVPSAQMPIVSILAFAAAVGQTSGCSGEQQIAP